MEFFRIVEEDDGFIVPQRFRRNVENGDRLEKRQTAGVGGRLVRRRAAHSQGLRPAGRGEDVLGFQFRAVVEDEDLPVLEPNRLEPPVRLVPWAQASAPTASAIARAAP